MLQFGIGWRWCAPGAFNRLNVVTSSNVIYGWIRWVWLMLNYLYINVVTAVEVITILLYVFTTRYNGYRRLLRTSWQQNILATEHLGHDGILPGSNTCRE